MLWKDFINKDFINLSVKKRISFTSTGKLGKVSVIITEFLKESNEHYTEFRSKLRQYKTIFQYVYLNVFPEIYCATERRKFNLKRTFHIIFKTYKDKKNLKL